MRHWRDKVIVVCLESVEPPVGGLSGPLALPVGDLVRWRNDHLFDHMTGHLVGQQDNRHPVAIKINNYPRSNRPQWGLSLADIVYEYYHNNDLPRFHAIFYGNDAPVLGVIPDQTIAEGATFAYMDLFMDRLNALILDEVPCPVLLVPAAKK